MARASFLVSFVWSFEAAVVLVVARIRIPVAGALFNEARVGGKVARVGVGVTGDAPRKEAASLIVASVCFHPTFCVRSRDDGKLWSRGRHLGSGP